MSSGYANQAFNGFASHPPSLNDSQSSSHMDQFDIKHFYDAFTNDNAHTTEHFDPHLTPYDNGFSQGPTLTAYAQQGQTSHEQQALPIQQQIHNHKAAQHQDPANFHHFQGGLHIQSAGPEGLQSYGPTHMHESKTVATLEAAAARSTAMYSQPSTSSSHASSRRSTMDGVPHIASLSLSSPRHSLSATSSASSAQNSPTTPLSAYSMDSGSHGQIQQQQQYSSPYNDNGHPRNGYPSGYAPPAHPAYAYASTSQSGASALLSMSMPPSMAEASQSQMYHAQYQQPQANYSAYNANRAPASVPLSQSVGRLSSAGLMDQIVPTRRHVVSPDPSSEVKPPVASKKGARERKDSRSSRSSRSRTSTPPTTPARAATLRSSRAASNANQAGEDEGSQTPSSVGPHRTPSKRIQAALDSDAFSSPSSAPQRPGGLRRSASEYGVVTPKTAKKYAGSSATGGLGSPADMDSVIMRQQSSQEYTASMAASQRSAGVAAPTDGASTGGSMMRTRSSPGFAPSLSRPGSSGQATGTTPRRSSTLSGLHMSPMPRNTAAPSPSHEEEISFETASLALDQIALFLSQQSVLLAKAPNQDVRLALGTFEQSQSIEDLRARVQARSSSSAFLGLA